ncbi:MAG: 50S ribosomal protein L18 [Nanoarchaeota archaeon]
MSKGNTYTVKFRRRREGITDYYKRLRLLKSGMPRLVIRKFLNTISAQIVTYSKHGDNVIVSAHSKELNDIGWNMSKGNIPSAYLVGLLLGKKALKKNINSAILDLGLITSTKGSRIYSALKGAIDAGIDVPCNKEVLPAENRIKGNHIMEYSKQRNMQCNIGKLFEEVKDKIERL